MTRKTSGQTFNGLIARLYKSMRDCSAKRKHPGPLFSFEEFRQMATLNLKFNTLYREWVASVFWTELRPSIDRLDDRKPYEFGNIEVVTWKENREREYRSRKRRRQISITLPPRLLKKIDKNRTNTSRSAYIERAIRKWEKDEQNHRAKNRKHQEN